MAKMRRVPVGDDNEPVDDQFEFDDDDDEEDDEPCACPVLERREWHNVESDWDGLTFVAASVNAVGGVPVRFGQARDKLRAQAVKLGGIVPDGPMLLLGPGRMRRKLLLEVEDVDPKRKGITVPGGVAYSRLENAPLGEMKRFLNETEEAATKKYGEPPENLWVWYLTCRHCSVDREYETLFLAHYPDREPSDDDGPRVPLDLS